jgi:hypothetical protein
MNQIQNDQIDLFELFHTLWDGKWIISTFIVLTSLLGFGYTQVVQPKYNVSVPYKFDIYSVNSQQICSEYKGTAKNLIQCMELISKKRLLNFLKAEWGSNFSLSTTTPLSSNKYEAQLKRANEAFTNDVYVNAKAELAFIQTEMADALLNTERVAKNILNAKRIINSIDNGQSVITFGSISIVKSTSRLLIISLSVLLGGIFGILFIIVRNTIKKLEEQVHKE